VDRVGAGLGSRTRSPGARVGPTQYWLGGRWVLAALEFATQGPHFLPDPDAFIRVQGRRELVLGALVGGLEVAVAEVANARGCGHRGRGYRRGVSDGFGPVSCLKRQQRHSLETAGRDTGECFGQRALARLAVAGSLLVRELDARLRLAGARLGSISLGAVYTPSLRSRASCALSLKWLFRFTRDYDGWAVEDSNL
jgi:hypothetical protein